MSRNLINLVRKIQLSFLSFFFDHLYHSWAKLYDVVAWCVSAGQWHKWGESSIQFIRGRNILDLGSGTGHLTNTLAQRGYCVYSLDESWRMAEITSKRMKKNGLSAKVVRGCGQSIPFPNNSFDSVIANFPTSHVFDPRTIHEVNRVLQPGGLWIILLGVKMTGKSITSRLLAFLLKLSGETIDNNEFYDMLPGLITQVTQFQINHFWREIPTTSLFFMICTK